MDYIASTKTLFVGTKEKDVGTKEKDSNPPVKQASILTINIEKWLDPAIQFITDFDKEDFNLEEELTAHGYQPGSNLNDLLQFQKVEVNNIEDMEKIEKLLQELKLKEEKDREDVANRSEFLSA
eukprot:CAMPEP_0170549342 /NCGR_PEP_ID=MMETSP0211-20121228/7503_1 /TAXON_ID=311385 /ORGANISM="Pseudokeronopsis sp., Strain OXSARD2" /LENGTH=123 /DNA_ID=CAMNT_0010855299 /DNA_START=794 /DNA_END=1165 /DNA_ORIENTATION=+